MPEVRANDGRIVFKRRFPERSREITFRSSPFERHAQERTPARHAEHVGGSCVRQEEVDEIARRREHARAMGGEAGIEKHHARGKLTIRERIDAVLDEGSFREFGRATASPEYAPDDSIERPDAGELRGRLRSRRGTPRGRRPGGLHAQGRLAERGGPAQEDLRRTSGGDAPRAPGAHARGRRRQRARVRATRRHRRRTGPRRATLPHHRRRARRGAGCLRGARRRGRFPRAASSPPISSVMAKDTAQVMVGGPALVERALGRPITKDELSGADVHALRGRQRRARRA